MRWACLGWLALGLGLAGCGLRSDPLFEGNLVELDEDDGDDETDTGMPGASECDAPTEMPPGENITVRGRLSGRGGERGWCGQDAGPEKVYSLAPPYNTDITLAVTESEVPGLTLRVVEDGCSDDEGITRVCANDFLDAPRHFLVQAGHTYSIIVDSDAGAEGEFEFSVTYGWPLLEQCTVHEEVILQQHGGSFVWFNEFGRGQGVADGLCGGAGRENMFPIQVDYSGGIYAEVVGSNGFEPVISLRTNCAAVSEVTCSSAGPDGYTSLQWFLDPVAGVGTPYYLAVDQVGYEGGSYSLSVFFD